MGEVSNVRQGMQNAKCKMQNEKGNEEVTSLCKRASEDPAELCWALHYPATCDTANATLPPPSGNFDRTGLERVEYLPLHLLTLHFALCIFHFAFHLEFLLLFA